MHYFIQHKKDSPKEQVTRDEMKTHLAEIFHDTELGIEMLKEVISIKTKSGKILTCSEDPQLTLYKKFDHEADLKNSALF